MSDVAVALKDLRTTAGVSVTALAESVGVSRNTVTNWENGSTEPTVSQFDAILESLCAPDPRLTPSTIAQWMIHSPLSELRKMARELKDDGIHISFVCGASADS